MHHQNGEKLARHAGNTPCRIEVVGVTTHPSAVELMR